MLERFTVDVLAEEVASQLLEGEPSAKLAHRFFRKGRRDGKLAHDHASVSKLLTDAVHLAGSTLVEELTARRRDIELRRASCEAAIQKLTTLKSDQSDASAPGGDSSAFTDSTGDRSPGGAQDSAQKLKDALDARRSLQARREAEAQRAGAEARAQARQAELDAARAGALQAEADKAQLEREAHGIEDEYVQRFESIKHTGELLWARYCNGFVAGEGRRGSRSTDVQRPSGQLTFTTPFALQSEQTAAPAPKGDGHGTS